MTEFVALRSLASQQLQRQVVANDRQLNEATTNDANAQCYEAIL